MRSACNRAVPGSSPGIGFLSGIGRDDQTGFARRSLLAQSGARDIDEHQPAVNAAFHKAPQLRSYPNNEPKKKAVRRRTRVDERSAVPFGPPVLDPGHPRHDRAVVGTTSSFPTGMCLKFVRSCYNVPPQYATAAIAWSKTKYRHTSTPPKGVPVWWTGGSRVSVTSRSLPVADLYLHRQWRPRPRWPDVDIAHHQGMGQTYRGWTEDINRVRVYRPSGGGRRATSSVFDASAVAALFRRRQKHDAVLMIQGALAAEIGLDFASGPGVPGSAPRPHTRNGNASSDSAGLTPTASPAIRPYAG